MSEFKTDSYFRNIQSLRAVAALLVLAFHVYAVEGKYFGEHVVPKVLGAYGTCGVDLFFVISGFVMTTVTRTQFGSRENAVGFLKRRVMRIYPLYWFYSLIVFAVMLVMPQWVNSSTGHHVEVLRSFLLLPSATLPLLLQGWTLVYEMFFYVVFAALLACITERWLTVALIVWAAVTCSLAYLLEMGRISDPSIRLIGDPLVLEFIAGCFCAMAWPAMRGARPFFLLAAAAVSSLVSVAIGGRVGLDEIIHWRAFYFGLPAFFLVLGAVSLEAHMRVTASRVLRVLGDASYSLYLSHVLVISAVGRVYARFALDKFGPAIGTLLCIVVAIFAGYFSYRVVEQPLNDLLKRIFKRSEIISMAQSPK
jgi:exopolysaccharide production protein ExoZ